MGQRAAPGGFLAGRALTPRHLYDSSAPLYLEKQLIPEAVGGGSVSAPTAPTLAGPPSVLRQGQPLRLRVQGGTTLGLGGQSGLTVGLGGQGGQTVRLGGQTFGLRA